MFEVSAKTRGAAESIQILAVLMDCEGCLGELSASFTFT